MSPWAAEIALHSAFVAVQTVAQAAERARVADNVARLKGIPTRASSNKSRIAALFTDARRWRLRSIAEAVPDLTANQVRGALDALLADGRIRSTHKGTQLTTYYNPRHEEGKS